MLTLLRLLLVLYAVYRRWMRQYPDDWDGDGWGVYRERARRDRGEY